jgi:hypothetical protein
MTLPGGSPRRTLLDAGDRRDAGGGVELRGIPRHLVARDPERVGDVRDLLQQLHGRDARADDDDALAGELAAST